MRPSETSEKWQHLKAIKDEAVQGISKITAPTLQDEARIIATIFRDTLETKGRTAALVTNDQSLASRVTGMMAKWGIELDHSAGTKLSDVPSCVFMRLLARMAEEKISPITMLACLKHPMAASGGDVGIFKSNVRAVEKEVLRGLRLDGGIAGMKAALEEKNKPDLNKWLGEIENIIAPFANLMKQKSAGFGALVESHIKVAENLSANEELKGAEHLWGRDDGEALKEFFDELLDSCGEIGNIEPSQYTGVLEALLAGKIYRPKYGSHPRLAVLSPMEARMQGFDLVILGGLNEGSWPGIVEAGPWMSRPMRKSFGLPLPERKIGQSAHDFASLLHAKNVVLTRSEKVDGMATIACRWLCSTLSARAVIINPEPSSRLIL
jgi:ATP-dependent helicase/nuclease subunit B